MMGLAFSLKSGGGLCRLGGGKDKEHGMMWGTPGDVGGVDTPRKGRTTRHDEK